MVRQQQKDHSQKIIVYGIASWAWTLTVWIWTTIIVGLLIQLVSTIITADDPGNKLPSTWAGQATRWLLTPSPFPGEILRWIAIGAGLLLVIVPLIASLLKQLWQSIPEEILREDFDKLIDLLQKDTITRQLELLQKQLEQQNQTQSACLEALQHISSSLQLSLTSSTLQARYTESQPQQDTWQKELSGRLQDIQVKIYEQVLMLDNIYKQNKSTQERLLFSLQNGTCLLQQKLNHSSALPDHQTSGPLSDSQLLAALGLAGISPLPGGQLVRPAITIGAGGSSNIVGLNKPVLLGQEGDNANL